MTRRAYVAIVTSAGFSIGLADENEPGYFPQPSHGTFPTYEDAGHAADDLNVKLFGLSKKLGLMIGLSSMFPMSPEEHAERIKEWEELL